MKAVEILRKILNQKSDDKNCLLQSMFDIVKGKILVSLNNFWSGLLVIVFLTDSEDMPGLLKPE